MGRAIVVNMVNGKKLFSMLPTASATSAVGRKNFGFEFSFCFASKTSAA